MKRDGINDGGLLDELLDALVVDLAVGTKSGGLRGESFLRLRVERRFLNKTANENAQVVSDLSGLDLQFAFLLNVSLKLGDKLVDNIVDVSASATGADAVDKRHVIEGAVRNSSSNLPAVSDLLKNVCRGAHKSCCCSQGCRSFTFGRGGFGGDGLRRGCRQSCVRLPPFLR